MRQWSFPFCKYLADWVSDEKSWLRKYYPPNDEPHYDLTPETERAAWVERALQF
jgi:hypothetical protein